MRIFYILFSLILVVAACSPERKILTEEQKKKEEAAILETINAYNKALECKSFYDLSATLAKDIIFFGTDSSEIIREMSEYKKTMEAQWKQFDKVDYGEPKDINVLMDNETEWANIIYGIPMVVTIGDKTMELFLRVSRNMAKQDGKWVIVSGIVSDVTTSNQQLDNLVNNKNIPEPAPAE